MVKEIDVSSLNVKISEETDLYLLDIRSAGEVVRGVLPSSQHVPMHLLPLRITEFPKDKDIYLYCHSGSRSYHACQYLMQQGVTNVVNVQGGILSWARSGFEVITPE